jgi:hypothetical protein
MPAYGYRRVRAILRRRRETQSAQSQAGQSFPEVTVSGQRPAVTTMPRGDARVADQG